MFIDKKSKCHWVQGVIFKGRVSIPERACIPPQLKRTNSNAKRMKFSVSILALFGIAVANTIEVRQDSLAARVKAIEDFLSKPDSSCVANCQKASDACGYKCPVNAAVLNDSTRDVRCSVKSRYEMKS